MTLVGLGNGTSMTSNMQLGNIVDLERYPIDRLEDVGGVDLVVRARDSMRQRGLCLLPGFIREKALRTMREEALRSLPKAFFCHNRHNAYLRDDDPAYPAEHPRRRRLRTDVGSIACDHLPADGVLRGLYENDVLTRFVGRVLGYRDFHRLADPIGAVSINVFEPGHAHAWHFDESHFSVTLMLQAAEEGGHFEYVPNLRSPRDDGYEAVRQVLDGGHSAVQRAPFETGALFLFAGRYSLHRVTVVGGGRPRLVPVLCYDPQPGIVNSDAVRLLFWGRTGRENAA